MSDYPYYGRDGEPITRDEAWASMASPADRRVDYTETNGYRISTVYLPHNMRFSGTGAPLVFESMVFEGDGWTDVDCDRYATEDEAREGHARLVEKWGAK